MLHPALDYVSVVPPLLLGSKFGGPTGDAIRVEILECRKRAVDVEPFMDAEFIH